VRGAIGGGQSTEALTEFTDETVAIRYPQTPSLLTLHDGVSRNTTVDPNSGDTTFYLYL